MDAAFPRLARNDHQHRRFHLCDHFASSDQVLTSFTEQKLLIVPWTCIVCVCYLWCSSNAHCRRYHHQTSRFHARGEWAWRCTAQLTRYEWLKDLPLVVNVSQRRLQSRGSYFPNLVCSVQLRLLFSTSIDFKIKESPLLPLALLCSYSIFKGRTKICSSESFLHFFAKLIHYFQKRFLRSWPLFPFYLDPARNSDKAVSSCILKSKRLIPVGGGVDESRVPQGSA